MIRTARRLLGIAIAAQIGCNDSEFACQRWRDLVPVQVREGIAVHQQQGRTIPARHCDDTRATGLDFGSLEAVEHFETSITNFRARQEATKRKRNPRPRGEAGAIFRPWSTR